MASLLSNGATILLVALLALVIAYRYYSAFIAAKLLALDPARRTPAHTRGDGQPTNKWVLFAHQFVALSGAGSLIGPVLAAQFGYLPGLLWILIGVCLAGAAQDLIVLGLSLRRNGRSLAQIASSEMGPASGKAATIGILLVLVIALAALGKVMTQALGGRTVPYAPGTEFIAREDRPIAKDGPWGKAYRYILPPGTLVKYPPPEKGSLATWEVSSQTVLMAAAPSAPAVDIEDRVMPPGRLLLVPFGTVVNRVNPAEVYKPGTEFGAPDDRTITLRQEGNVYYYLLPAGTRIVPRDAANKVTVVKEPFEITARAKDLGLGGAGGGRATQRQQINVPFGSLVTQEAPVRRTFEADTQFMSARSPIVALGMTNNIYRYSIPAGTTIIDPNGMRTSADRDFEINVRPVDITVSKAFGYRLVVPAGVSVSAEVPGSSWGTFAVFLTIPIALCMGVYLTRLRKGRVLEAAIIGAVLTLAAVYLGGWVDVQDSFLSSYQQWFSLSERNIGLAVALYGLVAALLPAWVLSQPRDHLAGLLKVGMVALLVAGVIVAHPHLETPAFNGAFAGGGPVVSGAVYPFLFITIMCGAVSGLQALVSSGTTPRRIGKESDARPIGYGVMLLEGLVGVVALLAASALPAWQYYDISAPREAIAQYQVDIRGMTPEATPSRLGQPMPDVGEHVQARSGAATLAMGMAHVLNTAVNNIIGNPAKPPPWLMGLLSYWYHLAIVLVALFILTTVDTGTRVGRSLLQEAMSKRSAPGQVRSPLWAAIPTTVVITGAWWYLLHSHAFAELWTLFGIASQLLAGMALAIASAALVRGGERRYVAVTLVPMIFFVVTAGTAAVLTLLEDGQMILESLRGPATFPFHALISGLCVAAILVCAAVVVAGAWRQIFAPPALPETADAKS